MKKKHNLRESIKSLIGTHLDPEQDEQLKGTKIDIDTNVEKMLKLIKEENHDETLAEMIEDFHKQYHSIYDRYDHLTGELRKKVLSQQEIGSSSSSASSDSDSDANHSSKRKESTNGKTDAEKVTDEARQELETATLERESDQEKIEDGEKIMTDLRPGSDHFKEERNNAKLDIEAVKEKLESALEQVKEKQTQIDSFKTQKGEMEELFSNKSAEASNAIRELIDKITAIEQERDSLQTQKRESETELMQKSEEISELMILIENLKGEIASKTRHHQTALEEIEAMQGRIEDQQRKYKEMQIQFNTCNESLGLAEKKIEDMDRIAVTSKEMIDGLKGEIESKTDELTISIENVHNFEVQLRLSNQKVRVTEQSLAELEETHRATKQKFRQEKTVHEEKIAMLSSISASNSKSVIGLSEELNLMTSKLESTVENLKKEFGSYEKRINEATVEIKITQANYTALNDLNNLFLIQLKECRDIELRLTEKVKKDAAENEKVAKIVLDLDAKVIGLEAMLKEKDEGMMGLAEEKREAIRQLCMGIEYHSSRCDYLKELLSNARAARTCW